MFEELQDQNFIVISVALDKNFDDPRPWIEAASATYPCLIDTNHLVADLYNMVNVPTILWIDENGVIVRPNDVAYGNNQWLQAHGLDSEIHKKELREWVNNNSVPFSADRARDLQHLATAKHQEARAEFALARWLWEHDRASAAEVHFVRAGELAPDDFTIRRGSMPMRDIDPMGPEFFEMIKGWTDAGKDYYLPLPKS